MKIFYWLFLLLCGLQVSLYAQSPSITINNPEPACLNSIQKIPITITGKFKDNNRFAVQVRKGDNLPVISEIPAQLIDGNIQVIHSDSSLSIPPYVQFRIVTTSPKVESNWHNVQIHTRGSVELSTYQADTINVGEDLFLKFRVFSSSTAYITLSDNSTYNLDSFLSGYLEYIRRKPTVDEDPVTIVRAENTCGVMKASGVAKAVINPTSIKTVAVYPTAICEGTEIKVSFSTFGPALPAATKFKLRITVYNEDIANLKSIEIPAQLKDNVLVATFPTSYNLSSRREYKLRIVTENPGIVGMETDYSFYVQPKAGAAINTPSKTINIGEKLNIGVTFSGISPYTATLQDGTEITGQTNSEVTVRPDKTTSYYIKSYSTGCGTETVPASAMLVTVRPGIYMDATEDTKSLCEGSLVRIKMLSNINFNPNSTFRVNAFIGNTQGYSFVATKVGDYLEFRIPVLPKNTDRALSYDMVNGLNITSANPAYTSERSGDYVIRSMPNMAVLPHSELNYKFPQRVNFVYELQGRGPFTIVDEQDKIHQIEGAEYWSPDFYLSKTTDFKLKSISNSCFKNEVLPSVRLTLDTTGAAGGIHLQPLKSIICRQDSLEITFKTTGTFKPDNVFNIEGYVDCCDFKVLATANKDGTFKVKVPASQGQSGFIRLRVASTNPVLYSESFQSEMQIIPDKFTIDPAGTSSAPVVYLHGAQVPLTLSADSGRPFSSITYTDGTTEKTQEFKSYDNTAFITPSATGITTAYTIKSAANQCGSFPVNLTTHIRILPYQTELIASEYTDVCQNGNLSLRFVTKNGDATKGIFTLQIAKDKSEDFTDLLKNVTSRSFDVSIPASFATGLYQLRAISSEGSISNVVNLRIGSSPGAVLATTEKDPIILNPGAGIASTITFTGTPEWTVIYENGEKQETSYNPYTRNLSSDHGKDFSILSVYNSCGYGPVSGKVTVKVNPVLTMFTNVQEVCAGESLSVRYQLNGDVIMGNEYIRFQLVDIESQKVFDLDSTQIKSGNLMLKIPAVITGNTFELRCTFRSYNLTTAIPNLNIKTKVDVSLSGNNTINAGETTQLLIVSNRPINEAIRYRLSTGLEGTFYGGRGNLDSYIKVNPSVTTTYSIVSANNGCGEGKKSGMATVEVNAASNKTVTVTSWDPYNDSAFCLGDAILVSYTQSGSFSPANVMTVQISDTTGKNFRSVTTTGNSSPLRANVPGDLFIGKKYRIRVVGSDVGTASGAYEYPLSPGSKATAKFASESILYDATNIPKLVVVLDGTGPWTYNYGSDLNTTYKSSVARTDTIYLQQNSLADYYKLFSVSNQCGLGSVLAPHTVKVEVITGEPVLVSQIIVAPNPAEDHLILKFPNAGARTITLLSSAGVPMLKKSSSSQEEQLKIQQLPAGIYLLNIDGKNSRSVHKIVKR